MAKYATSRGDFPHIETLKYAHTAAVEDREVLVVNGQVLVSTGDYDADEEGVYVFRGPVEFDKEAALAIAPGEVCYWTAALDINKTATANTKVGICIEDAAGTDSTVLVMLGENK